MEDDLVVASTTNGHHVERTIDPTMISLNGDPQPGFLGRKDHLPILSYGDSTRAKSVLSTSSPVQTTQFPNVPASDGRSVPSSSDLGSDDMDIASSPASHVEVRNPPAPTFPPLPYSSKKTGLVYDSRMRFHAEPLSLMVNEGEIHPEDPRRIHEIFQEIQQAGLVQGPDEPEENARDEQCWRIHARSATRGEVCLIHTSEHYAFIESLQGTFVKWLYWRSPADKYRQDRRGAQRPVSRYGFDIFSQFYL